MLVTVLPIGTIYAARGENLLSNGTFDIGISGWKVYDSSYGGLSTINQTVKISFELVNAELYSYKFADSMEGDVNGDMEVNICDLVALRRMKLDGEGLPI